MIQFFNVVRNYLLVVAGAFALSGVLQGCTTSSGNADIAPPLPTLPVVAVKSMDVVTEREYPATVEGKVNVEIRPQVDGYLDAIFVDEGEYVKKGQSLFRINDRLFKEQLANANASLQAAVANKAKAQLEVERLTPLVNNNVVSDVQLKTAESELLSALASIEQSRAMVSNAQINLGYTVIKAPADGYIGRIPHKIGSLVGRGEDKPLTVLSDVQEVYAYFSMSEVDFLNFKDEVKGSTMDEKLKNIPPIDLVLADGSVYEEKGKVEAVEGQFDKTTGAISFRATFSNASGVLRSGNTGRVRMPKYHKAVKAIPQESTFELQDKVLVFVLSDSNQVVSKPIKIEGQNESYYFVNDGIAEDDKIVYSGITRLRDGAQINPQEIKMDSLLQLKPLRNADLVID